MRCLSCRWIFLIFHPHRRPQQALQQAHPPHPRDKHDDDGCKVEEPAQEAEPADLQLAYVSLSGEHIQSGGSCGDDDDEDNHQDHDDNEGKDDNVYNDDYDDDNDNEDDDDGDYRGDEDENDAQVECSGSPGRPISALC